VNKLTVVVLTLNEEANISYCLSNVIDFANEIIILDSFSTDSTVSISESFGAKVYFRKFDNYANQRNYAINELPVSNPWMLFLDADEWLTNELKHEISAMLLSTSYDGFLIKRRLYFSGKWIKYGGYYPSWNLRLFRKGLAIVNREINEHVEVNGKVGKLKNDMVDENHKGLTFWLYKHIRYAQLEAAAFAAPNDLKTKFWGNPIERKNWIRQKIWNKILPPFIRPFIYFFYRYFIRFGFLDGKVGLIFHFLQALWYPFLIDVFYVSEKSKKRNLNIMNRTLEG
jgi:glycosyltransferase involved in cell wall biosynthesis